MVRAFDKTLIGFGFVQSKCDPSLLVLKTPNSCLHILIYVDDIIITGASIQLVQSLISKLNSVFALKLLGNLDYFSRTEVKQLSNGSLLLSQGKYIRDLLQKAGMVEAKGISTPLPGVLKLSKHRSDYMEDPTHYRSIVGALQYITMTRPEISYSVNKVYQFRGQPLLSHWQAVKRILRYLKGTIEYGLEIQPCTKQQPYSLHAYCDADWASDVDDRRSTLGACLFLGPNLISRWSKKQTLVAKSSAVAEYRSLASVASKILWVESLLQELQVACSAPTIYYDNQSTVALSHSPVLHNRTKHMELDIFFVGEKVLAKLRFAFLGDKLKVFSSYRSCYKHRLSHICKQHKTKHTPLVRVLQ